MNSAATEVVEVAVPSGAGAGSEPVGPTTNILRVLEFEGPLDGRPQPDIARGRAEQAAAV